MGDCTAFLPLACASEPLRFLSWWGSRRTTTSLCATSPRVCCNASGLCKPDALQHTLGEVAQRLVVVRREPHQLKKRRGSLAQASGRNAVQSPMQIKKLGGGQPLMKSKVLG